VPAPAATPDPTVVRLANGNWPPYNGEELPHGGCDAWIISEAFALEGITVEYGYFPWARGLSLSAAGVWDGAPSWADNPEHREKHYVSAEATMTQEWVFFYRADQPLTWETVDDLAGRTIGVTAGYYYGNAFSKLRQKGTAVLVESQDDEANFKMLLAGRIDVLPMERHVGNTLLKTIFTPAERAQIAVSERSFAQFEPHLLLSKAVAENETRMAAFDRGLRRLKESEQYTQILKYCDS
jgi:polar amino acid transport system substrate-binding protein